MTHLSLLVKVMYKPKEAFEELKGEVTWKDGIFVTIFSIFMGLLFFGGFSRAVGTTIIPFNFGIGLELDAASMAIGLGETFFILIAGAWVANFVAQKLGGTGNFYETLGMFGYGKILLLFQSFASMTILAMLFVRNAKLFEAALAGKEVVAADAFGVGGIMLGVSMAVFTLWNLWIQAAAVSAGHGLGFVKSLAAVAVSLLIVIGAVSLI